MTADRLHQLSFSPGQRAELEKPLGLSKVKTRRETGRDLNYIESWFVEAEANRIFGFDGWTSTVEFLNCVAERDVMIGQREGRGGYPGYSVSYVCRVRVETGGVTRDGVGAGHGIHRDLGLAHESAVKEAASDAEKRALKTFGNVFGLALYDKAQENVEDDREAHEPPRATAPKPAPSKANGATRKRPQLTLPQRTDLFLRALDNCKGQDQLSKTYDSAQVLRDLLDKSDPEALEGVNHIYRELWGKLPPKAPNEETRPPARSRRDHPDEP